ncbi:ATP-binding protein [Rhizobium sp. YIM 134829]|uniref:GAF domain-containing sensor histidine kinase n=1 Tax=Rhizobium sp. YIM 134829 TaxID=3390453 RepID=UPI00397E2911
MYETFENDVASVQSIPAVTNILDVVCRVTGMGFAAVARVTDERWIACQVLDNIHFGLPAGGELKIETTICNEIRDHRQIVAIDNVAEDPVYCNHHTPRHYGLQSYISVPIVLADGRFFGTLCAIDSAPVKVNTTQIIGMFRLFAELIGYHLDTAEHLKRSEAELNTAHELAELREQFIAVLGHDLRNPIAAVDAGINRLIRKGWTDEAPRMLVMMKASINRMTGLVANVMDLARSRLGGGIALNIDPTANLVHTLDHVAEEFEASQLHHSIERDYRLPASGLQVDHARIAQMVSNLIGNALTHGSKDHPVLLRATIDNEELVLDVINKGEPIPPEKIDKLFHPFHREGTNLEGLGLGLFIASEIAKAHSGTLTVHSDEQATTFTFRMPIL